MNDYEWLKNLVVGSKVFVSGREDFLTRVSKITATKIEVEGSDRSFRTDNGRERGGDKNPWNPHHLVEVTPLLLDDHNKKRRRQFVARINWNQGDVSDDQILAIYGILRAKKS